MSIYIASGGFAIGGSIDLGGALLISQGGFLLGGTVSMIS